MLDVTRMLFVRQVCADLVVGELASEPGVPPEEERHEDDQPGSKEKERTIARRHFVMRRRGGLPRGILLSDYRRGAGVWGGLWAFPRFSRSLTLFSRCPPGFGVPFFLFPHVALPEAP